MTAVTPPAPAHEASPLERAVQRIKQGIVGHMCMLASPEETLGGDIISDEVGTGSGDCSSSAASEHQQQQPGPPGKRQQGSGAGDHAYSFLQTLTGLDSGPDKYAAAANKGMQTAFERGKHLSAPQLAARPMKTLTEEEISESEHREAVADLARVLADLSSAPWHPNTQQELERLASLPIGAKAASSAPGAMCLNDSIYRSRALVEPLTAAGALDGALDTVDPGQRIARAAPFGLGKGGTVPWETLTGLVESESLGDGGDDEGQLVEVNSGGKVFFGLLGKGGGPPNSKPKGRPPQEEALIIKFGPNKLGTQSEFFAYELAALLGVRSPPCCLLRKGQPEWVALREAAEALAGTPADDETSSSSSSSAPPRSKSAAAAAAAASAAALLSWMKSARCLLLIGFVPGSSLHKCPEAFAQGPSGGSIGATAEELGRVLVLDMVLCNSDRLPVPELGWRGNPDNLRSTPPGSRDGPLVVTIDHTLARRPPPSAGCSPEACAALTRRLLRGGASDAAALLQVAAGAWAAAPFDDSCGSAFLEGLRGALEQCRAVAGGLEMLRGRMEDLTSVFLLNLGGEGDDGVAAEAARGGGGGGPGPIPVNTIQLRKVQKKAKLDHGFQERFSQREESLKRQLGEVQASVDQWRTRAGVQSPLTTGFLDSAQPLVQAYELKVRLEHILERSKAILEAAGRSQSETTWEPTPGTHRISPDFPVEVFPRLFIGGILAAGEEAKLLGAGITHIVNATGDVEDYFPEKFKYLDLDLDDTPGAAGALAASWDSSSDFIHEGLTAAGGGGGGVLVHCFEGKSRSSSLILSYLVSRRKLALRDALQMLKTAHPPTRPNFGFMNALRDLDLKVHGKASTRPVRMANKPEAKVCPVCEKEVGVSNTTLSAHMRKHHPEKLDRTMSSHSRK